MKKPIHPIKNPNIWYKDPYTILKTRTYYCQKPKHHNQTPVHRIVKLPIVPSIFGMLAKMLKKCAFVMIRTRESNIYSSFLRR